jgi:hypothetical protein
MESAICCQDTEYPKGGDLGKITGKGKAIPVTGREGP